MYLVQLFYRYEISLPLSMVLGGAPFLLATTMNGDPLPEDHGAPVRLIAPGFVGARNVKWLSQITVRGTASESPWQQQFYTEDDPVREEEGGENRVPIMVRERWGGGY